MADENLPHDLKKRFGIPWLREECDEICFAGPALELIVAAICGYGYDRNSHGATISVDRQIGLLLPCNVVVRSDLTDDGAVIVEAMNPQVLVEVTGEPGLKDMADQVAAKMQAAIDLLAATSTSAR